MPIESDFIYEYYYEEDEAASIQQEDDEAVVISEKKKKLTFLGNEVSARKANVYSKI